MSKHVTIEFIRKEISRMDPNLDPDEDGFVAAVVMLSALQVGTGILELTKYTGYEAKRIGWIIENLVRNRIFGGGKVAASDWFGEEGGCAFWLCVACAAGMLQRSVRKRAATSYKIGAKP